MKATLLRSLLTTLVCLAVFGLLHGLSWPLVASTSVASTAYVLFAMPESVSARVWNTLGGNVMGLVVGIAVTALGLRIGLPAAGIYAVTVGLVLFLLQVTNAQHPPAAGAALTVPLESLRGHLSWEMAGSILLTVVLLLLLQRLLRRYL